MESYGITLFCDDIRFEQFGKLSLIGCYGHELLLHGDFPCVLPRLGIFVQLRSSSAELQPSKISIYMPGLDAEPAVVVDIPARPDENISSSKRPQADPDIIPVSATNVPLVLGPVVLENEGYVKVRVSCGDRVLKVGTLRITKSSGSPPAPSVT